MTLLPYVEGVLAWPQPAEGAGRCHVWALGGLWHQDCLCLACQRDAQPLNAVPGASLKPFSLYQAVLHLSWHVLSSAT